MIGSAWRGRARAAAAGLAAALLGIGAGELVATLVAPQSSPFAVVGGVLIDAAPAWAKDTAIALFGTGDKAALLTGIAVVLVVVAGALGVCERRWRRVGVAGLVVLGAAVALLAPLRAGAVALSWLPALVAGVVAAPRGSDHDLSVGTARGRAARRSRIRKKFAESSPTARLHLRDETAVLCCSLVAQMQSHRPSTPLHRPSRTDRPAGASSRGPARRPPSGSSRPSRPPPGGPDPSRSPRCAAPCVCRSRPCPRRRSPPARR
ncbi:membrane hypothetical protein [Microbacterium sp. 8M]|uniref:hypothetical protein n=1 Tax=Microbacterium sp. 8M TaxID=2653153 RepID=UPI0012F1AAC6|nr:membrane hypothetical protein [Microbacterium sp. 8M]